MTNTAPPCPMCANVMEAGVVVGRSPGVKFKKQMGVLGDIGGIRLTRGFGYQSVEALRCDACGTVVIPGS
ncbi:PF20097 family protein [Nonomuraea sp. SBT364]|uniref:PF20097 family protein n=1 Tax=Nonomuraea sp. SBT364 TaxID=1580530 RepID=UPI000AC61F4B|nr:PF20097 family protein [Nonomuraea sp. SBT364]